MHKQEKSESHITHKETRTRARSLWLSCGKLRHALPVVLVAVAALIPPLTVQTAFADSMVQTTIYSSLATNDQTAQSPMGMTWTLSAQTSLPNTTLVAHIHIGNCMGDKILMLPPKKTDQNGFVDWGQNWFQNDVNGKHVWTTIPSNMWFLNIHDTDVTAPEPPSIGCIPISPQSPDFWGIQGYNTNTYVSEL
jgi:hypothetical protein